jgi:hypothetical protein
MMSKDQLIQLGIAATAAVKHQRMVGAFEIPPDMANASKSAQNEFWRHQQVALATQRVCSFKDMVNDEYNLVMQHFEALAGPFWKGRATKRTVKVIENADCDRAPGCEYVRDLRHWMAKAGFKDGYLFVILQQRFKGADIRSLRTWQLKQLHDTIVNRCRAKLGLGDPDNRNKKQRQGDRETIRQGDAKPASLPVSKSQSLPASVTPPAAGAAPAPVSRSREYILRPRPGQRVKDPENEPF